MNGTESIPALAWVIFGIILSCLVGVIVSIVIHVLRQDRADKTKEVRRVRSLMDELERAAKQGEEDICAAQLQLANFTRQRKEEEKINDPFWRWGAEESE